MSITPKCTACGGSLEEGFIPDVGHAQTWVAIWVGGSPTMAKGIWERIKNGTGVSLQDVDAKMIDARRCTSCGHLELFATKAPTPGASLAT